MTFTAVNRSILFLAITALLATGCADMQQSSQQDVLRDDKEYKAISDKNKSVSLVQKSKKALKRGDFDLAETLLERAIRKDPYNGWLWFELASVNYERGDYDHTLQLCRKSLSLAQNYPALQNKNRQLMKQVNKKE